MGTSVEYGASRPAGLGADSVTKPESVPEPRAPAQPPGHRGLIISRVPGAFCGKTAGDAPPDSLGGRET